MIYIKGRRTTTPQGATVEYIISMKKKTIDYV
jgi:hypothetical protein